MQTIDFDNGDRMPMLGLGTWKSEPGEVYRAVKEGLRLGYRHIDCAPVYGNEPEIGQALAESFADGLVLREQVWITSKLWNDSHAPEHVRPALEKTLADLRLDALDLYLIHWPVSQRKGTGLPESAADMIAPEDLPLTATWEAMEGLVDAGLCRHLGVSNFNVPRLREVMENGRIRPETNQIELHPYLQQPEMLDFCRNAGIPVTAYSPLGSPDRPDFLKTEDEPVLLEDPTIAEIARRHGVGPGEVLIAWGLQRGTAVLVKSVNPDRLARNLAAADLRLGDEDMQQIAALDRNRRYVTGHLWAMEGSPYTVEGFWAG